MDILIKVIQLYLCFIWIFHGKNTADTAAVTCIQLYKFQVRKLLILQILQHPNHILNSISSQVVFCKKPPGFSSASSPADSNLS